MTLSLLARGVAMLTVMLGLVVPYRAKAENTLRLDYAYYNPVSLVLKEKHWVEEALGPDTPVQCSECREQQGSGVSTRP